jgi:hypothetical protein
MLRGESLGLSLDLSWKVLGLQRSQLERCLLGVANPFLQYVLTDCALAGCGSVSSLIRSATTGAKSVTAESKPQSHALVPRKAISIQSPIFALGANELLDGLGKVGKRVQRVGVLIRFNQQFVECHLSLRPLNPTLRFFPRWR